VVPGPRLSRRRAERLAARLGLDFEAAPICLACLTIVAFGDDSPRAVQGRLVSVTRDLWVEGLREYATETLTAAMLHGDPDAQAALADLEDGGGSSPVARAMVLRLAQQMRRQAGVSHDVIAFARRRFDSAQAELN
jgi:hypothetical protein